MEKEKLLEIRNIIDDINRHGVNEKNIIKVYEILGNDNIPLVFSNGYNIAAFNPVNMNISINLEKAKEWLIKNIVDSRELYDIKNKELLKAYLLISMIGHEVEHSDQKLIVEGLKEPNYDFKKIVYSDVFSAILIKKHLIPNPISLIYDSIIFGIYKSNAYNMILERNALIAGYNTAALVAMESNDIDELNYLMSSRNTVMLIGYLDGYDGDIKYTYKKLGMMNKYKKIDFPSDMSLTEKIKEGLTLNKGEKSKLFLTYKQTTKFT